MHLSAALSNVHSPQTAFADRLDALRQQIDGRLAELVPPPEHAGDLMGAALHEGVLAPGKRIRPLLMVLVGRSLGQQAPVLLDLACAVEMVHAASLFLDDMPCMDNARLRRGRPAVHARYGEDIAMLGAVALVTQAFSLVASVEGLSGDMRAQLVRILCNAVGMQGLVRGQYRDLREGSAARRFEDIASTNQQKTGSLFSAAFEMAALSAQADEATRCALRKAALALGHAFQLRDDLEDGLKSPVPAGKDRNKDVGKSTLVALMGQEAAQQSLADHLAEAQSQLHSALPADEGVVLWVRKAFSLSAAPAQRAKGPDGHREYQGGLAARVPRADISAAVPGYVQGPRRVT
ncbi:MAG: Farnesyltranstransferase (Geranylgeranyl-diphosphate synthase)-like protein [Polaromonas sp.]|jgi:geranylgeranyl diphosphate synthase type II|nr:Farnesyltranstransferase (Geranylgeranyl-diphosphate synthase)-like protein [Polaromonas sp.]